MAKIPFPDLLDLFVDSLERQGASVIRESPEGQKPARVRVVSASGSRGCLVFLWTITPGGGNSTSRPANERRVQATGIDQLVRLEPGMRTLFGGFSPEFEVFCFWDATRHARFRSRSNSLQTNSETLETASHLGVATHIRPVRGAGEEVVVAVRPDSLLWFVEYGAALQSAEGDAQGAVDLLSGDPDEERQFIDEPGPISQVERRFNLVTSMRALRDSMFRPRVLQAYQYKCAVCNYALKLVDAAHIVPVSYPQSNDEVTNGLALCRLHHGAYDNGLLGVQSNCSIVVNPDAERRLAELNFEAGLEDFRARLPARIREPHSIEARPDPRNLKLGMQARRWPAILVA